ncbi:helix-turn-helix domain-containing protein [Diplocloster agilis]|uniref:helix-turn-helix domain-containing protein n=1 Tax=Diplocloster agilis TaxID=2850323 RepID=UPI000822FA0D|nr:helix-turn-helix domain-containing protein [Suonthocola fibrivorans]MCU6734073.1 helix-turn-helix domain-containing protein [Suonthocola fibrivorans]SCJ22931.1 DNA binding domain%2C excisionase family [uncultured Clostridium sp.]
MYHEVENNESQDTAKPEKWVNLEDIAEHLSVSTDTVRTWIKNGKLPFYRAGKRYKFKISEVDEWLREGKITE